MQTVLVSGHLYNPDGTRAANTPVRFTLSGLGVIGLSLLVPRFAAGVSDADGALSMPVVPSPPGTYYDVRADSQGVLLFKFRAVVPASDCQLSQIMQALPYPPIDAAQQALTGAQAALALTNENVRLTGLDAGQTALNRSATADDAFQTNLDREQTGRDKDASGESADAASAAQADIHDNWQAKLDAAALQAGNSGASANASEISRLASGVSAGLAATAKAAAELARDASFVTGPKYVTEALGRAAVADGVNFLVQGVGDVAAYEYRRTSSAASVLIASYPSTASVAVISALIGEDTTSTRYVHQFADPNGGVGGGITAEAVLEIPGVLATALDTAESSMTVQASNGFAVTFSDSNGLSAVGIKDDGTLAAPAAEFTTINGVSVASIIAGTGGSVSASLPLGSFNAEVNGVAAYGQSRARGDDAMPAISTAQRFDSLRFNGGVRADDAGGTPAANRASFVPLTEIDAGGAGETPITGATDFVKELILAENGLGFAQQSYQFLASAPAQGATNIANLSIGSAPFIKLQNDILYGFTLAQAAGKTYKFRAFTWSQGEADYLANTPAATYEAALIKLRIDIDAYAKSITGQTEDVICIMDQLIDHAARGYANNPYLAIVQSKVAAEQPHFYLATTLGHIDSSGVHHSAAQSKRLGAYFGLVYKRVEIDGVGWTPVKPLSMYRQGKVAMVTFNVPVGSLVFDTVNVAQQDNYGFTLVDSAGAALTISSVTLVQKDVVKVTAAADIPAGANLRYGWLTTSLGNLRDSQGDTLVLDGGGLNFPMPNFCEIFEKAFV